MVCDYNILVMSVRHPSGVRLKYTSNECKASSGV